jgi:CRP-like cAMP-binding protein
MVSPEILRLYPFFGFMNHDQLREVAMITSVETFPAGYAIFSMGERANALYLLREGRVDLHYIVIDQHDARLRKDFMVGTINPGELLGLSAVIEPAIMMSSAIAVVPSVLLRIDGTELCKLWEADHDLAFGLQKQVALALKQRLERTRILLAAATAPI